MKPKLKKLLWLALSAAVFSGIYISCVKAEIYFITPLYLILTIVLAVVLVLVRGGISGIALDEKRRREKSRKLYLEDKNKESFINKRDETRKRYRRSYTTLSEQTGREEGTKNIFGLCAAKQKKYSDAIIMLLLPIIAVIFVDYMLIIFS